MTARRPHWKHARPMLLAALVITLGGCGSNRDALLSEKVAEAEAAAQRAVKAQKAAEKAADAIRAKLSSLPASEDNTANEEDPGIDDDTGSSDTGRSTRVTETESGPA